MVSTYDLKNINDIKNYYINCWLNRFEKGHNEKSLAMHFGIFTDNMTTNEEAKINTNSYLANFLDIPLNEKKSLVDLGCGVGGTCIYLAETFLNLSVLGVNISSEQIDFANERVSGKKIKEKISFIQNDYRNTDLESNFFNYVTAIESVWHAENKLDVFKEAFRILMPDGKFVFIDYFQTRPALNKEEDELICQFNNGWGAYEEGTGSIKVFSQEYEKDMKGLGFKQVESVSLLQSVYKGITNSYNKATIKLDEEELSESLKKHYRACVVLKELVDLGIIDYRIVRGVK